VKAIVTVPPFDPDIPTLGFEVIRWMQRELLLAGEPLRLTAEQRRFLLWFYAVDLDYVNIAIGERGRYTYRRGVLRRPKGWGKSPFVGAIALAELCGPTKLVVEPDGTYYGVPHPEPWVVVAGVSESQTENTLRAVRSMAQGLSVESGGPLDIGKTRIIHTENGGTLSSITASSASQEGARTTFAVADEPHHWTKSNGGHELAKVMRRNLAKGRGRLLETTNAHEPGQDTVAEQSWLAYCAQREGKTRRVEILYDCREAPPLAPEQLADEATLRQALTLAYGDSIAWVDLDPLIGEIYDPSTPVEEGRRFYLNHIVAAADSWLRPDEYEANESEEVAPLAPGEVVTLGFDGALTDDSTALVAVRVSDGAPFLLGLWEKPSGPAGEGWSIDKDQVRGTVDHAFATYDVVAFFSDLAYWETDVDVWRDAYAEKLLVKATTKHAIAWDMRTHQSETVYAVETLHRAFTDRAIPILPDDRLKRHVLNARRRPNRFGVSFGKETRESPKKVDALAALLLARMARARVLAENALSKRRTGASELFGF
jgi:hypothetical protein